MTDQAVTQKPQEVEPKPPFPEQSQQLPGLESEMSPKPDYGEESYRGFGRLAGKAALVTGGDSGIGRAVALAFAREGADVLVSYLPQEQADAEEIGRAIEESGRRAVLAPGDISSRQHCVELVEQVVRELGRLDILVNNAAMQKNYGSIEEISEQDWEHTFRVNIHAMFFLSQAAIPKMREGGSIINTSSIQAYQPSPSLLAYASTKGAIVTFTKALAQSPDAMQKGIRVNSVAPGPVWTPLQPASTPGDKVAHFGEQSKYGRPAQPAELAPAYVFLASDESRYVNAEVIGVTGGQGPLP